MSGLSPERWEQVSAILDEALELEPDAVVPFLDERCGSDEDLRREVELMLDACARAEHLMDRPPALSVKGMIEQSVGNEARGQLGPGDLVGAYRIVDLLGRGGMGAVYLAERADGEFERQVALKVVKRGMDSDEILERFRAERQILAGLEHPNIAGLLDGGITADGRPFFAMELAVGEPIDVWCDRLRLP
ncbi:MAG: protein kinase, partial [Gemmatimonadetes bacterium]|nr:protein kinase [Gemmatimonadota bacterium]